MNDQIQFAIEYLRDECDDCPEYKNGECTSNSHCSVVRGMAIKALRNWNGSDETPDDAIEQKSIEYERAFMDGFESASDLFTKNRTGNYINRQDAIECLNGKVTLPYDMDTGLLKIYLQRVVDAIENLPSVQSEIAWVVNDKDEKIAFKDVAVDKAVKILDIMDDKLPVQKWIPCSESMPEEMKKVLIRERYYSHKRERHVYDYNMGWRYKDCWIVADGGESEVLAWCELPEPFRGM